MSELTSYRTHRIERDELLDEIVRAHALIDQLREQLAQATALVERAGRAGLSAAAHARRFEIDLLAREG
jgi:hypothetical protein